MRGNFGMKAALVALAAVLGAVWAERAARSVHAGTVRTSKGDMKILNVYHDDSAGAFEPNLTGSSIAPFIVGGSTVPHVRDFPQIVSLLVYNLTSNLGALSCSGSLVDEDIALTAAHCVTNPPESPDEVFLVCAGSVDLASDRKFRKCATVQDVYVPDEYNDVRYWKGYDMAILKLGASVLGKKIKLARFTFAKPANLTPAYMVGFGQTGFYELVDFKMYFTAANIVLNHGQCQLNNELGLGKDRDLICAKGLSDSAGCRGDSGSPLLVNMGGRPKNNIQVGIMSYGEGVCGTQWESVYTSLYDPDHKQILKYIVQDILRGSILRRQL